MGVETIAALGLGGSVLGGLWGAHEQGQANDANLAAQQAWQQQMLGMVNGQMQSGVNPYSNSIMQFMGMGGGGGQQGAGGMPWNVPQGQNTGQNTGQTGSGLNPVNGIPLELQASGSNAYAQSGPQGERHVSPSGGVYYVMPDGSTSTSPGGGERHVSPTGNEYFVRPDGSTYGGGQGTSPGGYTTGGGPPIPSGGGGPSMYQYQPQDAYTYDPRILSNPSNINMAQLGRLAGNVPGMDASFLNMGSIQDLLGNAPKATYQNAQLNTDINVPNVGMPSLGQAYNTGSDSLMQMLRNGPGGPATDFGLQQNLQGMYGGQQLDASGVLNALRPVDNRLINEQVSGLRGSAGSLGERLGSSSWMNERDLRQRMGQDINARNAGITQDLYTQGQDRRLQAMGIGAQREASLGGLGLQGQAQQVNAAQAAQQGALSAAQLRQSAQMANAQNSLQAQGIGIDAQTQLALQNAQGGLQASQANQNTQAQYGMAELQAMMQGMLANQQSSNQADQYNTGIQAQYGLQNQQLGLQALLANQQGAQQYALSNQNAYNQSRQFNAQQQTQNNMFNAQQGQQYNQNIFQGLGMAGGFQNQQSGLNAQLLGLLNGVGVPGQQTNPWPGAIADSSQMAMLMPLLMQSLGGQRTSQQGMNWNTAQNPFGGWV